jgi:single-strand DNA-binding protein
MVNHVVLQGHLTADPEVRFLPSGQPVCNMRIAHNHRWKSNGESKEELMFLDAVQYGEQAERHGQYLKKGSPVILQGRLRERRWEEQDGTKRQKVEMVLQAVTYLGRKEDAA